MHKIVVPVNFFHVAVKADNQLDFVRQRYRVCGEVPRSVFWLLGFVFLLRARFGNVRLGFVVYSVFAILRRNPFA
jgi:hypothetical protein